MARVFLDAAYVIALSSASDMLHHRARRLADRLEATGVQLVTTRAVMLEIGNALSRQRYRNAATNLLSAPETDPNVEIIPLTEELYKRAWHLYRDRLDKEWGLTDCISFVVMQDHGLTQALTADEHFRQAGFTPLMRDPSPIL